MPGGVNVMLGPVDTTARSLADAFTNSSRYVEISVSNRPPIAPRQQILTTPFAFQAANSAKLAGYDWSALFGTNNPVAGTIPFVKLAQRSIGTNVGVGGIAVSQPSGLWQNGTTNFQDISNLVVTVQTTGRPVMLQLIAADPALSVVEAFQQGGGAPPDAYYKITRNGGDIWWARLAKETGGSGFLVVPPGIINHVDFPAAGTHTYRLRGAGASPNSIAYLGSCMLVAFEL